MSDFLTLHVKDYEFYTLKSVICVTHHLKKLIIRGSYNIHCQIICEVVIEVVIVLTFSFSKKAFVRAFSLKMPNDINPKF